MGKLYSFILGLAIGAGFYHLAMHNHVIRANDGYHLIAKSAPRLADVFVDIREFTPADWAERPELALALQQAGLANLMTDSVENAVREGLDNLLGAPDEAAP
jgi:hypothetical protein